MRNEAGNEENPKRVDESSMQNANRASFGPLCGSLALHLAMISPIKFESCIRTGSRAHSFQREGQISDSRENSAGKISMWKAVVEIVIDEITRDARDEMKRFIAASSGVSRGVHCGLFPFRLSSPRAARGGSDRNHIFRGMNLCNVPRRLCT